MKESPGIRRLRAEHKDMCDLLTKTSLLSFECSGSPPTLYTVSLHCKGLERRDTSILVTERHSFRILLSDDFPFQPPNIIWMTPIYHPNFRPPFVCLGDHWYPGWSLAQMCEILIEMVQFKVFNVYDPLNKEASQWVKQRLEESPTDFPVDPRPVRDLDFDLTSKLRPKERSDA